MDAFEVRRIRVGDADQVVGGSGQQIALQDLVMPRRGGLEAVECGTSLLVERHEHESDPRQSGEPFVEKRRVTGDQPPVLQRADPAQAG